jgi:hypothetical protein
MAACLNRSLREPERAAQPTADPSTRIRSSWQQTFIQMCRSSIPTFYRYRCAHGLSQNTFTRYAEYLRNPKIAPDAIPSVHGHGWRNVAIGEFLSAGERQGGETKPPPCLYLYRRELLDGCLCQLSQFFDKWSKRAWHGSVAYMDGVDRVAGNHRDVVLIFIRARP